VVGLDFDAKLLESALRADEPSIVIPLIKTQPDIDYETFKASLFRDVLSSYTTYLDASNRPRTGNIKLAASFINETLMNPGDEFSYNNIVGQRTPGRGFQEAGAYVNGKLVPETGGGICQLSTTAYNSAVLANLKILERSNHSMTVGYVPLGRDAMVNWGTQDLRFQNTSNYPIQILALQSENYVMVTIMGTKENNDTVSIETSQISSSPAQSVQRLNNSMAPGTSKVIQDPHNGAVAESYRVIKDESGKLISRTREATSRYRKVDKITEVGPPAPAQTPVPDPAGTPPPAADPSSDPAQTPTQPPDQPSDEIPVHDAPPADPPVPESPSEPPADGSTV
jgi:vancomycin resistance protein YoaR